jgi:hypothetical protein
LKPAAFIAIAASTAPRILQTLFLTDLASSFGAIWSIIVLMLSRSLPLRRQKDAA